MEGLLTVGKTEWGVYKEFSKTVLIFFNHLKLQKNTEASLKISHWSQFFNQ